MFHEVLSVLEVKKGFYTCIFFSIVTLFSHNYLGYLGSEI